MFTSAHYSFLFVQWSSRSSRKFFRQRSTITAKSVSPSNNQSTNQFIDQSSVNKQSGKRSSIQVPNNNQSTNQLLDQSVNNKSTNNKSSTNQSPCKTSISSNQSSAGKSAGSKSTRQARSHMAQSVTDSVTESGSDTAANRSRTIGPAQPAVIHQAVNKSVIARSVKVIIY